MEYTYADPVWRKIQLNKILWITAFWMFLSFAHFLSEVGILYSHDALPDKFHFGRWAVTNLGVGLFAGLLGGSITVLYIEGWFRKMPFNRALLLLVVTFSLLFIGLTSAGFSFNYARDFNVSIFDSIVRINLLGYLISPESVAHFAFWLFVVVLTTIGLVVNDKYGPGVLRQVLTGKFYRPVRRSRIFMFLDLRGSTSIAERLGEEKYFNLLKEIIEDVTTPILYTRGEIYQYVGDEIVISWDMDHGRAHSNCIRCYFKIQEVLRRKRPAYLEKYQVEPEFKAGLHSGLVLAGEIGVVKRDITYTGDVLNTASRIQNKCNEFDVDILVSQTLLESLNLAPHEYRPRRIGSIDLRGKAEQIVLFTL